MFSILVLSTLVAYGTMNQFHFHCALRSNEMICRKKKKKKSFFSRFVQQLPMPTVPDNAQLVPMVQSTVWPAVAATARTR
jgi:hypothetical protein